ncbi:unnamed protein product [Discula destructiva]
MLFELITGVVGLIVVAYAAEYVFGYKDDSLEPHRLPSKVPLIGHVIGLIQSGPSYHSTLRNVAKAEIYTLGIFNFKLYTSVSVRLLPAIQRQSKTLSFAPMIQHVARRWGDASSETTHVFGSSDLVADFSHAMKTSLAPGPHLDAQNERMAKRVLLDVDELAAGAALGPDGHQLNLLDWGRRAITQASSCGVYGTRHPFLDLGVEKAFWDWHAHLSAHISGLNFDIFGKGYAARQIVFDAHVNYCKSIPDDASQLFKERWRVLREAGISELDCAKNQATLPIGMLSNTVPTFYWVVWELFSRSEILALVREELGAHAVTKHQGGFVLDIAALKTECPLLLSVFQETQRFHHIHAAIREVLEDTLLDGQYLLKKGNYLQMPGQPVHFNPDIWGPTASAFDPFRFVRRASKRGGSNFLAWGAPPHLCPARQFAATEILILVAFMVLRLDLTPVSGKWDVNPVLDFKDPVTVLNPKKDVRLQVRARECFAGHWSLQMSESTTRVPLASG